MRWPFHRLDHGSRIGMPTAHASGQHRTQELGGLTVSPSMSALPPKADMCSATSDVRLVPIADIPPLIQNE